MGCTLVSICISNLNEIPLCSVHRASLQLPMLLLGLPRVEIYSITVPSLFYFIWSHFSTSTLNKQTSQFAPSTPTTTSNRPTSPRLFDQRRPPPPPKKNDGFVWMTVPKNYRCVRLTAQPRKLDISCHRGVGLVSLLSCHPSQGTRPMTGFYLGS